MFRLTYINWRALGHIESSQVIYALIGLGLALASLKLIEKWVERKKHGK